MAERPTHDTVEGIAAWIVVAARRIESGTQAFDEFAWRLSAARFPLRRQLVFGNMGEVDPRPGGAYAVFGVPTPAVVGDPSAYRT